MVFSVTGINSSAINAFFYQVDTRILSVTFGGKMYNYTNVPQEIVLAFAGAQSKGSYYHQNIKNEYPTA